MRRCVVTALVLMAVAQAVLAVTAQHHQHIGAAATISGSGGGSAAAAQNEAGSRAPGAQDACVTAPTMANCSSFTYPQGAAADDLGKLCRGMPFMGVCSVATACNASGASPALDPGARGAANVSRNIPNVCDPFQLVTTACKLDTGMSRMSGCTNINSMCVAGSKVPSCDAKGLTLLPPTTKLNAQVRSICEEMTMDGCEQCMPSWQAGKTWADCDLLQVYSYLCYQMPEMTQCPEWHAMCKADPTLVFCYPPPAPSGGGGGGGGGPPATPGPVMKMYFFNEVPFYLLFKSWVPRDATQLAGAWLAIFALGLVYEALQAAYGRWEAGFWARRVGAHTAAAAAAAAAAAQRGMDEELGGPLAEGVLGGQQGGGAYKQAGDGRVSDTAAAAASGSNYGGRSAGATVYAPPPQQQQGGAVSPAYGVPGGKRPCCGAPPSGADASMSMHSAASGGKHGSSGRCSPWPCGGGGRGGMGRSGVGGSRAAGVTCLQADLLAMDLARGAARFVLAGLAYLLMLAAMSFNVAIFFAVISGMAAGSALFGRWRWAAGTAEGYSHCGCGSS